MSRRMLKSDVVVQGPAVLELSESAPETSAYGGLLYVLNKILYLHSKNL